ncbi:sorting nexin-19-like isoform X2 [Gigantopelta aegis]|uniref:sorting nexin-19-like isoform X2 n=1 Tax=Gigantopelta aegis TaxID=1735272 RepID=UPI001B88797D|nr:sorting nexin-19-like isoform X2 [Gigantopelta aegis]
MKIKALFNAIITSWNTLTIFQKIILVFIVLAVISYFTSYWSLTIVMILSVPLALKASDKLLQRKAPLASDVLLILVQYIKHIFLSVQDHVDVPESSHSSSLESTSDESDLSIDTSSITSAERRLVDLVIRDFVKSWFASFSKSPQFLEESRNVLYIVASNFNQRVSTIQIQSLTVSFISLYQHHLQHFQKSKLLYKSQKKIHAAGLSTNEKSKAKLPSLEESFGMNYNYHPALSSHESEDKYLRSISRAMLSLMVPDDVLMCKSSEIIFAEILTYKIFKNVISLMSDSDWLYKHMILLFYYPPANTTEAVDCDVPVSDNAADDSDNKTHSVENPKSDRNETDEDVDISPTSNETCSDNSDNLTLKDTSAVLSSSDKNMDELHNIPKVTFNIFEGETDEAFCDSVQGGVTLNRHGPDSEDVSARSCLLNSVVTDTKITDVQVHHKDAENITEDIPNPLKNTFQSDKERVNGNISKHLKNTFQSVKENLNVSISKQLKSTFHSLHKKSDKTGENILPKFKRTNSLTDVPNLSVCDDINEITVPKERHDGRKKHKGDDSAAVECPDEALPAKGNEIIRLTTTSIDETDDEGGSIDDPLLTRDESLIAKTADLLSVKDESLIFQDIDISKTEEFQEFRSNSKYTMYVIEYVALYFSEGGHPVLKSGLVKRRFREFVNLQARLDDESKYKNLLKDVKGPSRWATLPFKNRDKDSVESRRSFLDKFLKGLIAVEAVCNGPELRQFLAYEGDGHIAYVRKSPEMSVPRIDKMFARTMSEVFDRLKAIPDIPHNVISTITKRDRSVERDEKKKREDDEQLDIEFSWSDPDQVGEQDQFLQDLEDFISEAEIDNPDELAEDDKSSEIISLNEPEYLNLVAQLPRLQSDGSEVPDKDMNEVSECDFSGIPLTNAVFALIVQTLQGREHWVCRERIIKCITILAGRALNRWLCDQLEWLSSRERFVYYLTFLRESLWPNGKLSTVYPPRASDEVRRATREKAKQSLKTFLPGFIPRLFGDNDYDYAVEQIMESLEYEKLNRHLLYKFLDVLVEKIFPELSTQEIQQRLLS